jgi:hypothetical protein
MVNESAAQGAAQTWSWTALLFGYQLNAIKPYLVGFERVGALHLLGRGSFINLGAVNAMRITFSGGNIDGGTYQLIGMR